METILFTGGCRSGKSALAKTWTERHGARRAFVATAQIVCAVDDEEMRNRIDRHRHERGVGWCTVEPNDISPCGPLDAVAALEAASKVADAAVFDCVTMWISGYLIDKKAYADTVIMDEVRRLGEWLIQAPIPVALVTNEVGSGIVPESALGRRFRDLAGFANQHLAACCTGVVLAVCGLPLRVK